jgi:DNA mismatch endonuclease (patch repair protein)
LPDIVDAATRSRMMAGIRSKNTKPELILRRGLHARGLRYTLHSQYLPGRPDLVFPARKAVLFANGCFWHGHECHLFHTPATRPEFWAAKIARNKLVDQRSNAELAANGWRVGVVWECALKGRTRLAIEDVLDRCEAWVRGTDETLEVSGGPSR